MPSSHSKKNKSKFVASGVPLYYQLETVLRQKIISGEMGAGERMPTESELADLYNVSRITVRQALASLVREGFIERRQGSGTFIRRRNPFQGTINLTGTIEDLMAMGTDTDIQLVDVQTVQAGDREAEELQIEPNEDVTFIKRLRSYRKTPYGYIEVFLPRAIGEQLTQEDLTHGSLLRALENRLGKSLGEAKQIITASLADSYSAQLLEIRVGAPLLSIRRTVYDFAGTPLAFVHTQYRSDIYHFNVKLVREAKGRKWAVAAGDKS